MKFQLLKFGAEWCGPCQQQSQILRSFAQDAISKDVEIIEIDVDQQPELARLWRVRTLPTLILTNTSNSKEQQRWVGITNASPLLEKIKECLST